MKKVADASGSKYSAGSEASAKPSAPAPAPLKPAFTPSRSGAGSSYNPPGSSAPRQAGRDENVDEDGWGADAPQVSRSELEKVQSAYKPTKVNMAELTKQKQEPSRFNAPSRPENDSGDVVRGGYQPIGKVDIAAIRAQAKKTEDDRPTIVKGAYEPVGKVDIAAIRAKAQKPADEPVAQRPSNPNTNAEADEQPKSLAERSAAFSQSERLTSLPKPKVAHKFGSSNFTGTKAPTPGVFGLQSAPAIAKSAPVGAASKTFADEGGKTPAQIWAEKKAKERGQTGTAETSAPSAAAPITSQTSGNGQWKSGYAGKSWAPVSTHATGTSNISAQRTGERPESRHEDEAPASPAGGIGALRDRFKGAAPMGAPQIPSHTGGSDAAPPPVPSTSRPAAPQHDEDENRGRPNIPSPPRIQRSPTPPTPREESPVRIAMPVSRTKEPEPIEPQEAEPAPVMPVRSLEKQISHEDDTAGEPIRHDPARAAGVAVAAGAFGAGAVAAAAALDNQAPPPESQPVQASQSGGKRAIVQYDYEKAEDNEIELVEGDYVTDIDMVDDDWWMGTNSKGESGLFPSNYVELVEEDEAAPAPAAPSRPSAPSSEPEAPPAPAAPAAPAAAKSGPTATALYDYEAAEDNELSFDENDKITDLVS